MSWQVIDGYEVPPRGGVDARVWSWTLSREDEQRRVEVQVSGSAMSSAMVPAVVARARETDGASAIADVLEWEEPPERITFRTDSVKPLYVGGEPGPEVVELNQLVDWFQERGLVFLFAKRGGGTGPSFHGWTHTAHLIDPKADVLLRSFDGLSRLEAIRKARDWWEQKEAPPAAAGGSVRRPTLKVDTASVDRLRRQGIHLIWSRPDPEDSESGYMVEAYNDDGQLLDIAVQPEAEDALLTIMESLVPQGQEE